MKFIILDRQVKNSPVDYSLNFVFCSLNLIVCLKTMKIKNISELDRRSL